MNRLQPSWPRPADQPLRLTLDQQQTLSKATDAALHARYNMQAARTVLQAAVKSYDIAQQDYAAAQGNLEQVLDTIALTSERRSLPDAP